MGEHKNKWDVSDKLWAVDRHGYTIVAILEVGISMVCKCQTTVLATDIVETHNEGLESEGLTPAGVMAIKEKIEHANRYSYPVRIAFRGGSRKGQIVAVKDDQFSLSDTITGWHRYSHITSVTPLVRQIKIKVTYVPLGEEKEDIEKVCSSVDELDGFIKQILDDGYVLLSIEEVA